MQPRAGRRLRPVHISSADLCVHRRDDGTTYVKSSAALGPYPDRLTDRLDHWARAAPERTFLAERGANGEWQRLSYSTARDQARRIAQCLLDRELSIERPIAILSGNSLDHALLALGAMYAGVPYAPISPAYSLLTQDHEALRHIFHMLEPGLVFASDPVAFEPALRSVVTPDMEVVSSVGDLNGPDAESSILVTRGAPPPRAAAPRLEDSLGAAAAGASPVTPDTIAKILFTSGSTGTPKGVINTQRMLCSNQEMLRSHLAFVAESPPVLCDWLPWNHTFGGNHNFNCVLYNGGTLYIDSGRPTREGFDETIRNLADVAPTVYFNVPRGFDMLVHRLRADAALRERFFSRLQLLFFAAAGLPQHIWDALQDLAVETCGEEILMITGLGSTETAPAAVFTGREGAAAGWIGVPLPGLDLKLSPLGGKMEARLRGPSITPGYWRDDQLNRDAFDEEGFYKLGDAVRWVDPDHPALGLMFDGRLNEDFKLSSGTWVSVGPLRARLLLHFGSLLQDVVIAAPDRDEVGALVFPNLEACRALCSDVGAGGQPSEVLTDPGVRARFNELFDSFAAANPGTSTHVQRALLLALPPSFERRELTDKGSINQKAVMVTRAADLEELYREPRSPRVIAAGGRA